MRSLVTTALAAAALMTAGVAHAEDLEFKLTNKTGSPLVGFYVSHAGTNQWEENLLDGAMLDSGYEVGVQIADGREVCEYDIRGEFDDGDVLEDMGLDLCGTGEYTFATE